MDDETRIDFTVDPAIEVVKTGLLVDNGDNLPGVGDTAVFTIVVTNKGTLHLPPLHLQTFQRGNNTDFTRCRPYFNFSSGGSAQVHFKQGKVRPILRVILLMQRCVYNKS